MPEPSQKRIQIDDLRRMKAGGRKIAMLTAYDFPTAASAEAAGVHMLLVGDSLATVILGHDSTRAAPFELMVILAEAVRRGAPHTYLIGDMPHEAMADDARAMTAAQRFVDEAGCDAIKFEAAPGQEKLVARLTAAGIDTIVHLGLQPQSVLTPDGYRAQARDTHAVQELVAMARRMTEAGAVMLLLEAVPPEASGAVARAVDIPIIGCGAGPACDGHVVVTEDMLGISTIRPPRFVPVHEQLGKRTEEAMRRWVRDISSGEYPAPTHTYPMRKPAPNTSS